MSEKVITHEGIIEGIGEDNITIRLLSQPACSACHAKGICAASGEENKKLEIRSSETTFNIGEKVNVLLTRSLGFKALFLGYFLPFLIVFTVLVLTLKLTGREGLSGIISLGSLLPYYLSLRLFGQSIEKNFDFRISRIKNFTA